MRVQKATAVTIYTEPFDNTPSSISVAAVRSSDGSTIGTAPTGTAAGSRVGVALTAASHTNQVDRLILTVSATVNGNADKQVLEVDVVGSYYFTLGALRDEPSLNNHERFPDALLAEYRDDVESYVDEVANVPFTTRFGKERHTGDGTSTLVLRANKVTTVTAVSIDGVAQTLSDFEVLDGDVLHRKSGLAFTAGEPVDVTFEHGYDRPPASLRREMVNQCRSYLLARGAQAPKDRLWEQTADGLTVRFSTADARAYRYTGNADFDARITMHGYPRVGIA